MSCRPNYDPCLDSKLNQIGSYAAAARSSAQNSAASAEQSEDFSQASAFSAGQSATSSSQSSASATNSANSATDSANSASEANNYLTQVTNIFEDFDERYLGAKSVAPTVDNQGNPLQEGALYWNSVSDQMFAWNGTIWVATNFNQLTPFIATGTPIARNLVTRASDWVNVKDFGAVGNYYLPNGSVNPNPIDDAPAIQAAIDSLGIGGGTVYIPNDMVCLIDTALIINAHISLVGPNRFIGSALGNNWNRYNEVEGTLVVNPAITITMQGGSSINNLLIYRKGMTFPADPALYSGTAITATGDDVSVNYSMILGFNLAFKSDGFQRINISYLYLDNTNGIEISNCFDVSYIQNVHAWPFATIGSSSTLFRNGTFIWFHDNGSWDKITNCFCYGYYRGFLLENSGAMTLTGCGADNINNGTNGAIGFEVTGLSVTKLINCQSAANEIAGVRINAISSGINLPCIISNHTSWGNTDHGILIDGGNVIINDYITRPGLQNGITINNANSNVTISDVIIRDVALTPIESNVTTGNVIIKNLVTNSASNPVSGNIRAIGTIAASVSEVLNIPSNQEVFYIVGPNSIRYLQYGWVGKTITFIFAQPVTLINAQTNANEIRLAGAVNFTGSVGDTITLINTGIQWFEIARST